jgi:thiamine biosynthesis lipoprotein
MPSKSLSPTLKPSIEFDVLGTHWFIEVESGITVGQERLIHTTLGTIDRTWSRFRDDSLVATMSTRVGEYPLSIADRGLMQWYRQLYEATEGYVNPLVGQTLADAGYDASYRLAPKTTIATTPSWDEVIELTATGITIAQPAIIDVGAAGKGFAIDAVADLFKTQSYTIDAGGDIRIMGAPQTIGLEHPLHRGELIGTITVKDKSICGSAGNRRQWGDWHHIINPRTSRPVENIIATWAVADTAMHADGIASALFFVPPEQLTQLGDFTYVIMYENGKVYHTNTEGIQLFT